MSQLITMRNINNLRYADDTTLMAESEEELKSLLTRVKEESEKAGLKLNIQKAKIPHALQTKKKKKKSNIKQSNIIPYSIKTFKMVHIKKKSILHCSAFFMDQVSHLYMTTGKTIALTRRIFVSKVVSLLFNLLSRFVIALLPRSKHLLILWLQSLSAVIMEPKKMKSVTASTFSPSFPMK